VAAAGGGHGRRLKQRVAQQHPRGLRLDREREANFNVKTEAKAASSHSKIGAHGPPPVTARRAELWFPDRALSRIEPLSGAKVWSHRGSVQKPRPLVAPGAGERANLNGNWAFGGEGGAFRLHSVSDRQGWRRFAGLRSRALEAARIRAPTLFRQAGTET
jgi:hypothetical protein